MRKHHSAAFKASVVVEALRETKTLAQLAAQHQIHPTLITKWKAEALEGLTQHFQRSTSQAEQAHAQERKISELYPGDRSPDDPGQLAEKKSGLEPDTR